MKIITKKEALNVAKPEGVDVTYYLFDEYEMHLNIQEPHTTQSWHHHEQIHETLFIIEGELLAEWRDGEEPKSQIVNAGDAIETENTPHTFSNNSDKQAKFLVIKQVLSGENKKEVLKNDKILD